MECHHTDIQTAADAVQSFCASWAKLSPEPSESSMLVLQGQSGCGKTRLAKRVYAWALRVALTAYFQSEHVASSIPTVKFIDWSMVCNPERMSEASWIGFLEDIGSDSLVVIDDIGCDVDRFKSGASIERLCMVLNRRSGRHTMITTNHEVKSWATVFDARVSDRLNRNSRVIEMKSPSYATVS